MTPSTDLLGKAIHEYFTKKTHHPLLVHSEDFDDDSLSPSYFFREYRNMPAIEKKALTLCRGKILDVGACAGSHALWLQENGFDATALEWSEKCCQTMKLRGIQKVVQSDIFDYRQDIFDTILVLMNGTGIAGTLSRLSDLFVHLKKLLRPGGQILMDSSDLIYLYEGNDGAATLDLNAEKYYGELNYQFEYKGIKGEPFPWLYVDIALMQKIVADCRMEIRQMIKGKHYDYLVQITNH
ncbi:MAG: methyltransferase domain-containing protein [Prolixibacteraceae bacterium]|jgi:SAM-dependent methyltransferase|nr:methyltransferase domain-containing protein [Prolixibacteraceae bacterium]